MPKLVDHVDYRKQLLTQCFDLFAQRGYGALTMRQIAEALNVSTGTLYHYFPTKEALFQQLVEDVTSQTLSEATSLIQQQTTLKGRLLALFSFIEQHEEDLRKQFLITLNYYQHRDLYDTNAGKLLCEGANRYHQAVRDQVGLADPQVGLLLQSQIHGILIMRMFNNREISFREQAQLFVDMLTNDLQQKTASDEK